MNDTPTISVNGSSYPILCGMCGAPIRFRAEGDDHGQAGCISCDNWAKSDEIGKIAIQYVKDEAQLAFNRMARDAARNSKIMTFKGETVNHKSYRFIAKL